jgi:hypothetical protein
MTLPGARSIREKLNFILIATTSLALLLAGLALVAFDLRSQLRSVEDDLLTQADIVGLVSSAALVFNDPKVAAENLSVLRAKTDIVAAVLFDERGQQFAAFQPVERQGQPLPVQVRAPGVHLDYEWVEVWRPVMSGREQIGTVYLQARHQLLQRVLEYLGVLAIVLSSSLAAALLLSNRLQRTLTGPVLAISGVARQILRERDFSLRATCSTPCSMSWAGAPKRWRARTARCARATTATSSPCKVPVLACGTGTWQREPPFIRRASRPCWATAMRSFRTFRRPWIP